MVIVFVEQSLVLIAAALYALLFLRLVRSYCFWQVPFFVIYVAAMVPANLLWNPKSPQTVVLWGIVLISLRICVAIEMYLLAASSMSLPERRGLLAMLLGISVFVLWILSGYYDQAGLMGWYKSVRQMTHVTLATALLFGTLGVSIYPPQMDRWKKNHAIIGTLYFLMYAGVSFVKPAKGQAWLWYVADALFQVGMCACIWLWLLLVVPKRAKAPLQIGHTVV